MSDAASGGERTARRSPRRWIFDRLSDGGVRVPPLLNLRLGCGAGFASWPIVSSRVAGSPEERTVAPSFGAPGLSVAPICSLPRATLFLSSITSS